MKLNEVIISINENYIDIWVGNSKKDVGKRSKDFKDLLELKIALHELYFCIYKTKAGSFNISESKYRDWFTKYGKL